MNIKTNAFRDMQCTCFCGNKHELYGGKGYKTIYCEGYSNGKIDGGYYHHIVECKNCGEKSTQLQDGR